MQGDPITDDAAGPPGGSGGSSAPAPTKADCKLVELALRENWNISEKTRTALVAELASVVEEPGIIARKPRLFLRCVQAITALSRGNLASVDTAIRARQSEDLADRIDRLEQARPNEQGTDHEPA